MSFNKETINQAKELLGEKAAYIIAKDLNLDQWDEKNLKGCSPFKLEKTPSFVWNKKENYFKDFSSGRVYGILDHFQHQYGHTYLEAVKALFNEVGFDFNNIKTPLKNKESDDFFKNYKYPKEETNKERSKVEEYLNKRGISKETLDFAGIKQDKHSNIVFEFRDINNTLICTKYRPSRPIKKGEPMMFWQPDANTAPLLYGVNNVDITKPLLICEGLIDRLSIIEAGFTNAVSIPHGGNDFNFIEFNYSFLELFEEIILFYDNDDVGRNAINEILSRLDGHRCKVVKPTKEHEEGVNKYYKQFNPDLNINKTDANNILLAFGKQELLNLIYNAEEIEDQEVKDLMTYEYYSNQDREKFPTGIKALDRIIGGHFLKCLTLYTGYTGSGKTTAINQIALKPFMENKEKVFIFSGEMGGDKLMSWLIDSVAGIRHIVEWDNGIDSPRGYSVTKQAIDAIKQFYLGNIKNYDKKGIVSAENLLSKMEYCRKKFGIKHYFIDNLMCLMTKGSEDDKWQSQIEFIIRLANYAENKNVGIHLVAHPKKPNGQAVQSIYDISGASELANVCNRGYWIKKVNDPDKAHKSEIIVLKDRELPSEGQVAKLFYDKKTRILYGDDTELYKTYKWEESFNINYPESIKNRLICNLKHETDEVFGRIAN